MGRGEVDGGDVEAVEVGEGGEAVAGGAATTQRRGVAEEFGATVDGAITVAIQYQKAVVGLDPADRGLDAGAGEVEHQGINGVQTHALYAVTVEVKYQRVAARGGD